MIFRIPGDIGRFVGELFRQDSVFYFGCAYIVLVYMRPHLIYPQLNFLPWVQLVIAAGLIAQFLNNRLRFNFIHLLLFALAGWAVCSSFLSEYWDISKEYLADPFIFAVEAWFLSNCIRNRRQMELLLGVFFICMLKLALFGARVWAGRGFAFTDWGISGPPGFFQNSGELSLLMAIVVVASIPFFMTLEKRPLYLWVLPITATMTVLGASSRGGQLALLFGCLYLGIAYKKHTLKYFLVLLFAVYLAIAFLPEKQKDRFRAMGEDSTSITRLSYLEAGLDMMEKHPYFGVGYRAFPEHYYQNYREMEGTYLSGRRERAHNSFIEVGASIGIPALVIYILLHLQIFFPGIQVKEEDRSLHYVRMLRAALVTYAVGSQFMSVAFYPYIFLMIAWRNQLRDSFGIARNTRDEQKQQIFEQV